jgi:predicted pyridoxine 5'-phosphate oxidase superfamily flavin-nucleotide-binding protein
MASLPEVVSQAWDSRKGPVVFVTVDSNNIPNAIYATCVKKWSEDKLVIADNFFHKTRANIMSGSEASVLFLTENNKSYQVKGRVDYLTSGEIYDDMKTWLDPKKHPGHAAAVLNVEEVYQGQEKLV